jgi:heme exporter protein C
MATAERVKQPLLSLTNALIVLGAVLMVVDLYLIFMVAPTESSMGDVQRIFYIHLPLAIMSFLAFFIVFLASIAYLIRRDEKWDRLAHASAEVGVVFVGLALITGIIWARATWWSITGQWWDWEPKLTTTLILGFIYVAYLMVRAFAANRSQGAMYSAVVGIVGFVDVPIVYRAAVWWRGTHPTDIQLEPIMQGILLFSFLTFLVLFLYLVKERMALRGLADQVRMLRFSIRRADQ